MQILKEVRCHCQLLWKKGQECSQAYQFLSLNKFFFGNISNQSMGAFLGLVVQSQWVLAVVSCILPSQLARAGLGCSREGRQLCLIGVRVVLQGKRLQCALNLHNRGKVEGNNTNSFLSKEESWYIKGKKKQDQFERY